MADKRPITGYVDPNFPNPNTSQDAPIIIYGYTPALALGLLGAILFTISTFTHGYQLFRYRTWYFIPMLVGSAMEIVGYIFRILSSKVSPYNVLYFVIQYFFIVVAPVFFSAAIYTVLSILIKAIGSKYAPMSPKLILWIFITSDVIATVVQVAGAALIGSAESNREDPTTANNILLAGLAFQCFSFLLFIILLSIFVYRSRKMTLRGSMARFTAAVTLATLLVYLRTVFRLAETAEGLMQNLSTHEAFFGSLEFAPVILAVFIFNVFHPGKWVPRYPSTAVSSTSQVAP